MGTQEIAGDNRKGENKENKVLETQRGGRDAFFIL